MKTLHEQIDFQQLILVLNGTKVVTPFSCGMEFQTFGGKYYAEFLPYFSVLTLSTFIF